MQSQIKMIVLGFVASVVMFVVSGSCAQENAPSLEDDPELREQFDLIRSENFLKEPTTVGTPLKGETALQNPSAVTVIDRKMIEGYNFSSIASAVETLAGIQVYRTYFKHRTHTARGVLQNHYANKVLILINGVPSWRAITGEGNLDRVSIYDVERIEVLKGPASVIYGTQAYTGAINIVLRHSKPAASKTGDKPDSNKGEFHAGIESKGANSIGTNYHYSSDGLSIFAAVNEKKGHRHRYEFTDETGKSGIVDDYVDSLNASVLLEYEDHSLLFNAFRNDEGYLGVTPKYSAGAGHNHDVDGALIGYTYSRKWNERFYSNVQFFYDWNEPNFSRTANNDIRTNVLEQRVGGSIRNGFSILDSLDIEVGGDYDLRKSNEYKNINLSTNTIFAENNLSNRRVYEYSGYVQVDWKPSSAWRFLVGSRFTKGETFDNNVSSRGTIVYSINKNNVLKVIAGQSFRTPTLFELYFATPTKTVFGNENLNPETADTFELGYQHAQGNFYMQTLAYYSVYKDNIHRIKTDITRDGTDYKDVNVYANGEEFTAKGLEMEFKYLNPTFANIFLNLDYVHGNDGDRLPGTDHYNFRYVPKFTASAGVYKNVFGGFNVSLIGNYLGSTNGPEEKIDESFIFDLSLAYQHKRKSLQLKHVVSIHNVSDELVTFPEYVRRKGLNEVPLYSDRAIFYSLIANF